MRLFDGNCVEVPTSPILSASQAPGYKKNTHFSTNNQWLFLVPLIGGVYITYTS